MKKKIVLKFESFISNLEIYVITYILVQDLDNNQYSLLDCNINTLKQIMVRTAWYLILSNNIEFVFDTLD